MSPYLSDEWGNQTQGSAYKWFYAAHAILICLHSIIHFYRQVINNKPV